MSVASTVFSPARPVMSCENGWLLSVVSVRDPLRVICALVAPSPGGRSSWLVSRVVKRRGDPGGALRGTIVVTVVLLFATVSGGLVLETFAVVVIGPEPEGVTWIVT